MLSPGQPGWLLCPVTCGKCQACSAVKTCPNACNTYACGHPNCKPAKIFQKCLGETQVLYASDTIDDVPTDDGSAVPVGMSIEITEPLSLTLDTSANQMYATVGLMVWMQWEDSRLLELPCRALLEAGFIKRSTTAPADLRMIDEVLGYIWSPSLTFESSRTSLDEKVAEEYHSLAGSEGEPWLQPDTPSNASSLLCLDGCASKKMLISKLEVTQPYSEFGDYKTYPFDSHTVVFRFGTGDVNLSCASILPSATAEELRAALTPVSREWYLDSTTPLMVSQARTSAGDDPSRCEVRILVHRDSLVHVIKSIVLSIVTVMACLLANYMHPADHTGDRAAIVLVAALILTSNIQVELPLGTIQYLIWQDGLNLLLILITLASLVQTMTVHRIYHYSDGQQGFALTVDRACTFVVLCFLFPIVVGGYFCTAFDASFGVGVALLVLGPLGSLGLIYMYIQRKERASRTKQREVIIALSSQFSTVDAAQQEEILGRAFECFDRDERGYPTADELRRLLRALYSDLPPKQTNAIVNVIKAEHMSLRGHLSRDDFIACWAEVGDLVAKSNDNLPLSRKSLSLQKISKARAMAPGLAPGFVRPQVAV